VREIRLVENGVEIDKKIFKVGEVIKAIDTDGTIQFEGKVEFGIYSDEEHINDFHLGFLVGDIEYSHFRTTLIDLLNSRWQIIKRRKERK